MTPHKRIESLDYLRGIALIFIILFHSSIYNFANIHKIDFSNPPIVVVLMSFMALWGGIFIIYSMAANAMMLMKRNQEGAHKHILLYPVIAGAIYLFLHYVLNIFLGRWNNDFINNRPDMTAVASTLRNMQLTLPHLTKLFEGSSLSTIALNLMIVSGVIYLLFRNGGATKYVKNYLILAISGMAIMLGSFIRVSLFPLFTQSIETQNHLLATLYSFTLANPYPLLPYLAYGLFGALIGMMIYQKHDRWLKRFIMPLGILFLTYGIYGIMQFDKTISKPDYFWYFKTNFELGIFILLFIFTYFVVEPNIRFLKKLSFITWFSRVSLSIYLLETTLSELVRIVWSSVNPSWNQTINGSLLFGVGNIFLWILILWIWKRSNFKYSLEYFWVKWFDKLGKQSTKMETLL
ncbi:MAG: hypothetical protein WCK01_01105 [Candidatus Uhrbacteria bacterium]